MGMTLLQRREHERGESRERLRREVLALLRDALRDVLPGRTVYVYGSLTQPGRFHARSDIDLALAGEEPDRSVFRIQADLEERIGRPVDLCVLTQTRLRAKIETEGERWTN